jgi:hypothetical protein
VTQQVSTLDNFVGNEWEPSDQVVEDVGNDSIRGARDVRWEGSTKQRRSLGEKRGALRGVRAMVQGGVIAVRRASTIMHQVRRARSESVTGPN